MDRLGSVAIAIANLLLPVSASAQGADDVSLLASFLTWLPVLVLLGFFFVTWRGLARTRRRSLEHMDRVEAALGRIEAAIKAKDAGSTSER